MCVKKKKKGKKKGRADLIYVPAAQGYESCRKLSGEVVSL